MATLQELKNRLPSSPGASSQSITPNQTSSGDLFKPKTLNELRASLPQQPVETGQSASPYQTGSALTSPTFPYQKEEAGPASIIKSTLKATGNLPSSALRTGVALADPRTYINLGRAIAGGIQSIPGISSFFDKHVSEGGKEILDKNRETFQATVQGLKDQYGSLDNLQRSAEEDPIGLLLLLEGGAESIKKITKGKVNVSPSAGFNKTIETTKKITAPITEKIVTRLQERAVNSIADSYREVAGQTKQASKVLNRSVARGKDPAQFLAENKIIPEVKDGKLHTIESQQKLDTLAEPLNDHLDLALRELEPSVERQPWKKAETKALAGAEAIKNITETAREHIKSGIREEFDLLEQKYGETGSLTEMNTGKRGAWSGTKFDSTKPYQSDSNYLTGRALKEVIQETVPKDVLDVQDLNSHIGDIYDAKKFLNSLELKAVKGGRLGRFFARIAGTQVGSLFGPLQGIAGYLIGDYVSQILQSTTFSNPLKRLLIENIKIYNPAAYEQAIEFIRKSGLEREKRLLLTAPQNVVTPYRGGTPTKGETEANALFNKLGTP